MISTTLAAESSSTPTPVPLDARQLDEVPDSELDKLPFGVIALDRDGTILRYNLAESRLARLDRTDVLGKSFFREVAPCTQTPDFEGRFRSVVESGARDPVRFAYLFDFKFGAQEVDVEIVQAASTERFYVLINRRTFLPAREKGRKPAPLQRELAPAEADLGVRRDPVDRRFVEPTTILFAALRPTLDRIAPEGWAMLCFEWGVQWGRLAAIDLETRALEASGKSLRELSMRVALERYAAWFKEGGWGSLDVDFSASRDGLIVARVERSAIAEAVSASRVPRCQLFAGLFAALFGHLAARRLVAKEVACKSEGAPRCTFAIAGASRRDSLDAATASTRDFEQVVRRFREGRSV